MSGVIVLAVALVEISILWWIMRECIKEGTATTNAPTLFLLRK